MCFWSPSFPRGARIAESSAAADQLARRCLFLDFILDARAQTAEEHDGTSQPLRLWQGVVILPDYGRAGPAGSELFFPSASSAAPGPGARSGGGTAAIITAIDSRSVSYAYTPASGPSAHAASSKKENKKRRMKRQPAVVSQRVVKVEIALETIRV